MQISDLEDDYVDVVLNPAGAALGLKSKISLLISVYVRERANTYSQSCEPTGVAE
jgi:hypothetical protein